MGIDHDKPYADIGDESSSVVDVPLSSLSDWMPVESRSSLSPEQLLCFAQIEEAFRTVTKSGKRRLKFEKQMLDWIALPYGGKYPDVTSFEGCCLSIGINPENLRRALRALAAAHQPKAAPQRKKATVVAIGRSRDGD